MVRVNATEVQRIVQVLHAIARADQTEPLCERKRRPEDVNLGLQLWEEARKQPQQAEPRDQEIEFESQTHVERCS